MMTLRLFFLLGSIAVVVHASDKCESLKLKTPLSYTQDKAPRDLSGVLPVVVEKVNRELEGVVDVEVEWEGGDLHGKVGEHTIQCKVTRLASAIQEEHLHQSDVSTDEHGRQVVVQCFLVPFTILDTDECSLPSGHSMRHKCHAPAVCVNTIGSYECLCLRLDDTPHKRSQEGAADEKFWADIAKQDRSPWELSLNSVDASSCPSTASTHGCCPEFGHSSQGSLCRSLFRCPVDLCRSGHDCVPSAKCELADSPQKRPNFTCKCPRGLMGNGHACRPGIDAKPEPKVKFDGITPTEETLKHNYYCGCATPVVDACAGFPPCTGHNEVCGVTDRNEPKCICKPGYVRDEEYGCVDETAPAMRLRHDPDGNHTLRLKQGDVYKEYGVEIEDENAEDYLRRLKITYSQPLPPGCLTKIGDFHVNYTVTTPWTSPSYVRVTRKVIIDDIDECTLDVSKYESSCPEIIPKCDIKAGATCANTIGSYTCRCPKYTEGDGFKPIHATALESVPEGYKGGTGCKDTSLPVIDILGPNPKVLKVCKCGGLKGIMGGISEGGGGDQLCREQRKRYESGLRDLIASTAGAELCATHRKQNPKPSDCVKATDHTYMGPVDLSSRVVVGEPVQKSALHWIVPYNVMDDAGNAAKIVWRDVRIEEVDLLDVESRVRAEMKAERDLEIKEAVNKALDKERATAEQVDVVSRTQGTAKKDRSVQRGRESITKECAPCPECKCPIEFDISQCDEYCDQKWGESGRTCVPGKPQPFPGPLQFLQDALPPAVLLVVAWSMTFLFAIFVLRWCMTAIFNPRAYDTYSYLADRDLDNAVNYYRSPPGSASSQVARGPVPPTAFANGNQGYFSPPQQTDRFTQGPMNGMGSPFWSPEGSRAARTPGATPVSGSRQNYGSRVDDDIYADRTPQRRL